MWATATGQEEKWNLEKQDQALGIHKTQRTQKQNTAENIKIFIISQ